MRERLLTVAKEVAKIDKRQRDAEPEAKQGYHGCEGDCTGTVLSPYEEI